MSENNQAQTLVNVESLINSYNSKINSLTKEMQQFKDMVNSLLENDEEYKKAEAESKKTGKLKTQAKQEVLKRPEAIASMEKLKDYQLQIKEAKTALSDYLTQYVALSGTNQIEGPDGILMKIIYAAKLVKSSQN